MESLDLVCIPPGRYRCRIAEVRVRRDDKGVERWGIRWQVDDANYRSLQGRTAAWDCLLFHGIGMRRAQKVLECLGFQELWTSVYPEDLEGKVASVKIEVRELLDRNSRMKVRVARVAPGGVEEIADGD